jgi:type I restriction enzyme S subunit
MSFPRHKRYKDSGVEWLGEIPEHWEVNRLKLVADVFPSNVDKKEYEDEVSVRLCNYTDVYYNDEITEDMELLKATASQQQVDKFTLRAGDTIITKDSETADDIAVSAYVPRNLPGVVCGYHLSIVRPRSGATGRFLKRLFDADYVRSQSEVSANGLTRVWLSQYALDNLRVAYPGPGEQSQIALFLDQETAKIDALIEEQRRLIELLKEKRQAVISRAVAQGINLDVPLKDSGDEWLGNIPCHWDTRTIAQTTTKITNGFVGPTRDILVEEGIPYVQATSIKEGKVIFKNDYFVREDWSNSHSKSILKEGDVLVVQTGAGTGDVGLVSKTEDGYNCHALIILSPDSTLINGEYLSIVLQSYYGRAKLTSIQTGAMHPHLNCGSVKFIEIPLPNLDEQASIAKFADAERARFDRLTLEATRSIELFQERRSALISAAVTGKIDLRNYTPKEAKLYEFA